MLYIETIHYSGALFLRNCRDLILLLLAHGLTFVFDLAHLERMIEQCRLFAVDCETSKKPQVTKSGETASPSVDGIISRRHFRRAAVIYATDCLRPF